MVILGSTSVSAPTLWLLLIILCHLTMTTSALDDEDFFICERKNHKDFNSDKKHLKDCTFDNKKQLQDYFNCDEKDLEDHNSDDHSASPLCVPQDRVEDLDWYPDFGDDFISFSDLFDDSDTSDLQNDFQFSDTSLQDEKIEEKPLVLQHVFLHQEKRITPSAKPETQKKQVKIEEKPFLVHFSDDHEEKGTALSDRSNLRLFHQPIAQLMNDEKKPPLSFVTKKKSRTKRVCGRAWSKKVVVEKEKRCSHCESKETPQWRNGPMGPKTLCNACGVRYNSGRLVPEYRPAASPTFDATKHSNIHKKIVKMRGRHYWM